MPLLDPLFFLIIFIIIIARLIFTVPIIATTTKNYDMEFMSHVFFKTNCNSLGQRLEKIFFIES